MVFCSEDVEFVLFGSANAKPTCMAVCEVAGGPEYKITLTGEASTVSYSLDCSFLDFGKIVYTVRSLVDLTLFYTRVSHFLSFLHGTGVMRKATGFIEQWSCTLRLLLQ